jgi:hypothetical protein
MPNEYCTVEQVDPHTMWRMDMPDLPSCKIVIEKSHTLSKDQRYTHFKGRIYWMKEHTKPHAIELMEIEGPVVFDRLKSYLSNAYASDGSALVYGARRVRTPGFPINPNNLRRFGRYGIELSRYVTDGRVVLYEDRVLDGADSTSFNLITPPSAKEGVGPEFARDASSVYYGAERIPNADPGTFRLVDFSHVGNGRVHGYYAVDFAHVWNLSDGIQLVTPEYAEEIRQLLQVSSPVVPEPWEIPLQLKVLGYVLFLLIILILIIRLQARIRLRYQASLLSRAVGVLSVAYLVFPSIGYVLLFGPCSKPNDIVVWSLLLSGIAGGAVLLSVANCNFMHRADAAVTTAVQLGIVAAVLAVGTIPGIFFEALESIPAGISRQCPPKHHGVDHMVELRLRGCDRLLPQATLVATITPFRAQHVNGIQIAVKRKLNSLAPF